MEERKKSMIDIKGKDEVLEKFLNLISIYEKNKNNLSENDKLIYKVLRNKISDILDYIENGDDVVVFENKKRLLIFFIEQVIR